nr:hypothetical protein [Gammaproteobacteria bacterium]
MYIVQGSDRALAGVSSSQPTPVYPVCRAVIPEAVWRSRRFLYVGLEIYTGTLGTGDEEDLKLGRDLIRCIRICALSLDAANYRGQGDGRNSIAVG